MQAYANAGARIQEDISSASCIFGVKQVLSFFLELSFSEIGFLIFEKENNNHSYYIFENLFM